MTTPSESPTTPGKGVTSSDLFGLVRRFEEMGKVRRDESHRLTQEGNYRPACLMGKMSEAYFRCADELKRVLSGETPPEPGYDWPNTKLRDADNDERKAP